MPAVFKDFIAQEWMLRLTVGDVADVARETGVNLALAGKDADWVELLFGQPERLVSVLWCLCETQAKGLGLSPEDFARRFDGATLEAAGNALAEAISGFFPRSRIATAIREGLPKVMAAADLKAVREIDRIIADLSMDSNSPTSAPASAA
jgi:hypothetical protein